MSAKTTFNQARHFVALLLTLTLATAPAAAQGPNVGIKVHGHWTIDVRESNGTLVSHTEFENALMQAGAHHLTRLLGREESVGNWVIILHDGAGQGPCQLAGGQPSQCDISEPTRQQGDTNLSRTLSISTPNGADGFPNGTLVLHGTTTASRAGEVTNVRTYIERCGPSTPPDACPAQSGNQTNSFSGTTLAQPIPVVTGQYIQVTVTFSFS